MLFLIERILGQKMIKEKPVFFEDGVGSNRLR